jgi:hypothetical protein
VRRQGEDRACWRDYLVRLERRAASYFSRVDRYIEERGESDSSISSGPRVERRAITVLNISRTVAQNMKMRYDRE